MVKTLSKHCQKIGQTWAKHGQSMGTPYKNGNIFGQSVTLHAGGRHVTY